MANELSLPTNQTGLDAYALVRDARDQSKVYSTAASAFVTYATADRSDYAVDAAEAGTAAKVYQASLPFAQAFDLFVEYYARDSAGVEAESDVLVGTQDLVLLPANFALLAISAEGKVDVRSGVTRGEPIAGFKFFMTLASDHQTGAPGLVVAASRSLDNGAFAACDGSVTDLGGGLYSIDLSGADTDGATVTLKFTSPTADTRYMELLTSP
jgi:hypothetical protein